MTAVTLPAATANYSLCHGLAGAEVLLYGHEVLGPNLNTGAALAMELARSGIENYAAKPSSWPGGTRGDETPGLFLGLAV